MQKEIEKVRSEVQTGLKKQEVENEELRSEMRAEFAELNAKVDTKFAQMDTKFAELRAENAELRSETHVAFAELNVKIEKEFAKMRTENAKQRVEDKTSQLNQVRWIVGTIVAIGALIIAAGFFT